MDPRRVQAQFYSAQNESMIVNLVAQDFTRRTGSQLSERQATRLERTVTHYMDEVWEQNGPRPIQELNREVITTTINDFSTYLRRNSEQVPQNEVIQRVVTMPQRPVYQEEMPQQMLMDTGDRYEQLQQERNQGQAKPPRVPDFRLSIEDDGPSALSQFELAKKFREEEAAKVMPRASTSTSTSTSTFASTFSPASATIVPDPNGNSTLTLAGTSDVKPVLQQDYLIKQESVVSYRENEENLFVYSADRDWLNNPNQTRYNFTINFDVGNNRQGFGLGASATKKFKNIVRIELVKMIIPAEGIDIVMQNNSTTGVTTNTSVQMNALSFPYIVLRIPELDGNNYGSDNALDNAFGVLQYDANWNTDNTNITDGRGFLAMIPKFMKCQKVYSPTPLSTLTKLTFQIQRPSGSFISDLSDSLRIYKISPCSIGSSVPYTGATNYNDAKLTDTGAASGNPLYYIIQTNEAFSRFTFTTGDRILINGLDPTVIGTAAATDLVSYLQRSDGLIVVAVGFISPTGSPPTITDGFNAAGYANYIVVQAPFTNITNPALVTSSAPYIPAVKPFGGSTANNLALGTTLNTTIFTSGRVLNLSHQTQLVFRVITREMDPTMRVRPDNM